MFLFSGTFYPIDAYPAALQIVRPADAAVPGRRPDPVADRRVPSRRSCCPRRVPRDHGRHRAVGRVAPARPAAAQVASGRVGDRAALAAPDRGDRRVPSLPAAGRVARAGRPREGRPVPRRDVLGPAGAGVRRSRCADPAGRAGAGGARRQPDRAGLHRRRLGRLPVRGRSTRTGLASSPVSRRADDGLTLLDAYIAAAVRCAPPANKPTHRGARHVRCRSSCASWRC